MSALANRADFANLRHVRYPADLGPADFAIAHLAMAVIQAPQSALPQAAPGSLLRRLLA
jgi:hypothetical protein